MSKVLVGGQSPEARRASEHRYRRLRCSENPPRGLAPPLVQTRRLSPQRIAIRQTGGFRTPLLGELYGTVCASISRFQSDQSDSNPRFLF